MRASDSAFVTLPLDDRAAPEGTNIVILGTNGSGKSFYAKALLTGMLLSGYRVVVFDVDGEFRAWCEAWGGTWVDHTPGSGRYVEPMRIALRPGGYEDMVRRVAAVVSLLAGGLDALGENVVDKVTTTACLAAGVDPQDQATWGRPVRLRAWYGALASVAAWEVAGASRAGASVAGGPLADGAASAAGGQRRAAGSGDRASRQTAPGGPPPLASQAMRAEAPPAVQGPLEAAVVSVVGRNPALGQRALARALAAEGATSGRVYRILQRHGLETADQRRRWAGERAEEGPVKGAAGCRRVPRRHLWRRRGGGLGRSALRRRRGAPRSGRGLHLRRPRPCARRAAPGAPGLRPRLGGAPGAVLRWRAGPCLRRRGHGGLHGAARRDPRGRRG